PVDVPAFVDVDGDGDIDVLTYDVTGGQVEWHRNMQADSGWAADSMKFILTSQCWGHFLEVYDIQTMTYDVLINQTPCDQPAGKTTHAGGMLLPINLNADSLMDVVVSDVDVDYSIALRNGGAKNYASMDSVLNPWPPSYPVSPNVFPALSYADVNGDSIPDLLAAPYQLDHFNDYSAVWRYTNTGQTDLPTFDFQQEDFLQGKMLDGGTHAVPLVHDFNGDGLPDLLLAIGERFIAPWQEKPGVFYFYANIGDSTTAVFDEPVQVLENATAIMGDLPQQQHTIGDLDADGKLDMLIGYGNEKMLRLEANGNFTNGFPDMDTVPFELPELGFDGLLNPMPELYDLDADGDLDLFVGQRNGQLAYFENQGDSSNPDFVLITQNFGKFDASNANGQLHVRVRTLGADSLPSLVLGTPSGQLFRLDSLTPDTAAKRELMPFLEAHDFTRSPALEVLTTRENKDSLRANYLVGRWLGGLQLYSELIFAPDTGVSDTDTTISRSEMVSGALRAYPNPVKTQLVVETPAPGQLSLYDAAGRLCLRRRVAQGEQTLKLHELPQGVYLLELRTAQKHYTGQIIRQ
ncbi:MAG: T9SS type A sorting domain-containing protein, partial [Bacteroidota bacterium]